MTHAQLSVIADAAHRTVYELLYSGYGDGVELDVGFGHSEAHAAANLVRDAVVKTGQQFVRPLRVIGYEG
jgi:hypothetical protein